MNQQEDTGILQFLSHNFEESNEEDQLWSNCLSWWVHYILSAYRKWNTLLGHRLATDGSNTEIGDTFLISGTLRDSLCTGLIRDTHHHTELGPSIGQCMDNTPLVDIPVLDLDDLTLAESDEYELPLEPLLQLEDNYFHTEAMTAAPLAADYSVTLACDFLTTIS